MDATERIVFDYLAARRFENVVYEPDGNVPPNFLVDGRVAIEVRRLNQRVTDRLFDVSDIVALLETSESKKAA